MNPQSPWPAQDPAPQQPAATPQVPSAFDQPGTQLPSQPTPVAPSGFDASQATLPTASSPSTQNFSVDYLDKIAAPVTTKAPSKLAIIGLIGGVLLAALFAMMLLTGSKGPDVTSQMSSINARVATLQAVVVAQQKNLADNSLAEANATLGSTLTTMNTDMASYLPKKTDDSGKSKAAIAEKAYSTELSTKLDNAYQRGTLDRTYTVQMTYELTVLRGMLQSLKKNATKEAVKTFCTTSASNIDIILKQYATFDASSRS